LIDCCPTKVFRLDERENVTVARPGKCIYCQECQALAKTLKSDPDDDPVVQVTANEERFVFAVETTGALTAGEVVEHALEIVLSKITEVQTQLVHIARTGVV
jgi:DNA-directed RNA polymerase II subunit RPB3